MEGSCQAGGLRLWRSKAMQSSACSALAVSTYIRTSCNQFISRAEICHRVVQDFEGLYLKKNCHDEERGRGDVGVRWAGLSSAGDDNKGYVLRVYWLSPSRCKSCGDYCLICDRLARRDALVDG